MTNEKQGVSAWLRGIVDESYGKESRPLCPGIADTFFGIECREMHTCGSCILAMLTAIADRIDAERALPDGMEWPRFEDGGLVRIGDELEFEGKTTLVCDATFYADGWALWCDREDMSGRLYGKYGERVKRPAPKVLDADGVPIKVGDTVYCDGEDEPLRVSHTTDSTKVTLIDDHASYCTVKPSRLSHERPDSWEKLEEDVNLGCRDYCEKHRLEECDYNMRVHILARAKKLSGIEEEARNGD